MTFSDRKEAGQILAYQLASYANRKDLIVLGIPRGGVPVAFEIAKALKAPLDVFVSRKLGVPGQEELAFGAIATGRVRILDAEIVEAAGLGSEEIERIAEHETRELERRERAYRGGSAPLNVERQTVILVDDGIATGSSMLAAIKALRRLKPAQVVVAVPVAPLSTCRHLRPEVDDLVCASTPEFFQAIGQFYDDFSQVSDEEVKALLQRAARPALQKAV
jgi:putative phosphoribosyl transferase